ncbi:hypothetical protein Ddye_032132 [Dipteronia dyeriana]|uniref:Uncharacterized protein n=1 Tax=Dipteronia dyeriana TaxID=168575 RepID=A0AAD9TJL3_9ROSI|nr:hypothetical protein Ddye_032132 [Dipteronia dyeriana]
MSFTFPWNNQSHVLQSNEDLMIVFEEFDRRSKPVIEFDLNLYPLAVEFPDDDVQQLLTIVAQPDISNGGPYATSVKPDILNGGPTAVSDEGDVSDESEGSDVDNEYEFIEEPDGDADSNVSLDYECEEVNDGRHDHCDPDGEDTCLLDSSDEETGLIKMVKYCRQYQWRPDPHGSIKIRER